MIILVTLYTAKVTLAVRTWAVWNRNKGVGISLTVLSSAACVLQAFFLSQFLNSIQSASIFSSVCIPIEVLDLIVSSRPYPRFRGCFNVGDGNPTTVSKVWIDWILWLFADGGMYEFAHRRITRVYFSCSCLRIDGG